MHGINIPWNCLRAMENPPSDLAAFRAYILRPGFPSGKIQRTVSGSPEFVPVSLHPPKQVHRSLRPALARSTKPGRLLPVSSRSQLENDWDRLRPAHETLFRSPLDTAPAPGPRSLPVRFGAIGKSC